MENWIGITDTKKCLVIRTTPCPDFGHSLLSKCPKYGFQTLLASQDHFRSLISNFFNIKQFRLVQTSKIWTVPWKPETGFRTLTLLVLFSNFIERTWVSLTQLIVDGSSGRRKVHMVKMLIPIYVYIYCFEILDKNLSSYLTPSPCSRNNSAIAI